MEIDLIIRNLKY